MQYREKAWARYAAEPSIDTAGFAMTSEPPGSKNFKELQKALRQRQ